MTEFQLLLQNLKRPGLLVRAARHAAQEYERGRHLRRILRSEGLPNPFAAARKLVYLEQELNDLRVAGDAAYRVARHVEVLSALIGENILIRKGLVEHPNRQTNASAIVDFKRAV
ncbi:MAG: DUF6477 family protein [Pseudomonadota bacterium]